MTVDIRRGSARFMDRAPGVATWHAFSFSSHYDPARVGFGPMVCHDEHRLATGSGFPPHVHSRLVIVTWVLSGALAHTSPGTMAEVRPGSVAVLHTGDGIEHSEVASAPQTRFVQVWLTAPERGPETSYDVTPVSLPAGSLVPVTKPIPGAAFSVVRLDAGQTVTVPAGALVHVFVARGALTRSSLAEPLHDGDAFLLTDEPAHELAAAVPAELLVWSFS